MEKSKESKIESIDAIPWIQEEPVKVFNKDTGYKAIVNPKTKETISIVSNVYQPAQHRDVYNIVRKLSDYKIYMASIYSKGRILMIEVTETSPIKHELIPGDYFTNRIRIFNSYDGTRALSVQACGLREVCTNGMIAPVAVHSYHKVHAFQNINLEELEQNIILAKELWIESKDLIRAATKTVINVKEVMEKFNFLPKKYTKIVVDKLDKKETVYNTWNEITRVISHEMQPKISTKNLVETQKEANKIFKLVEIQNS